MDYEKAWKELMRHFEAVSKWNISCYCTLCEYNRQIVHDMKEIEKDITYYTRSL